MMRLLLCLAAPLCLFASHAHAQEVLTATGSCSASEQVNDVLREKLGATRFRSANCDTMVSTPNQSVAYTRAGAAQDRVVFTGKTDSEGDLSVTTLTLGTAAPIPVELGFCNGGPIDGGQTATVCSAVYRQGNDKVGISVIFQGTPRD
jgi:hypothetical protein